MFLFNNEVKSFFCVSRDRIGPPIMLIIKFIVLSLL